MKVQNFRDDEIKLFYWFVVGMPVLVTLLIAFEREWALTVIAGVIIFGFLALGWPLSAEIVENSIVFKGPIRRVRISPASLTRVKGVGVRDFSAHIILRNKGEFPVGYRCRKYDHASELAQAVLDLIAKAPQAKVDPDAIKLLQQTAKGSRKALPLE